MMYYSILIFLLFSMQSQSHSSFCNRLKKLWKLSGFWQQFKTEIIAGISSVQSPRVWWFLDSGIHLWSLEMLQSNAHPRWEKVVQVDENGFVMG